jgi:hypothetical protein
MLKRTLVINVKCGMTNQFRLGVSLQSRFHVMHKVEKVAGMETEYNKK